MSGCDSCEGGWVCIKAATVDHDFPQPELPADPAEADRVQAEWANRRAMALNTWYPCKACNARAFFMWCNGHWDIDHDRSHCEVCADALGGRRHRVARPTTSEPVYSTGAHITSGAEQAQPKGDTF